MNFWPHPLLRNPTKWLRGVNKRHSDKLYSEKFYNVAKLKENPFAQLLLHTRKDISGYRFPTGNMVQIIVRKDGEGNIGQSESKPASNSLVPVLEKPKSGQNPASYLINNKAYIELLRQRNVRPVPLKHRQRNSHLILQLTLREEFTEEVEKLYDNEIKKEIKAGLESGDVNGRVSLTPETKNWEKINWKGNNPVIPSAHVSRPTKVGLKVASACIKLHQYQAEYQDQKSTTQDCQKRKS